MLRELFWLWRHTGTMRPKSEAVAGHGHRDLKLVRGAHEGQARKATNSFLNFFFLLQSGFLANF